MGTERRRRRRVERTEDWEQLEILCAWEEQREYEKFRPLVLFGEPVPERAAQIGTSERTLYWSIAGFEEFGPESPFGSEPAKRRVLPASLRRLILCAGLLCAAQTAWGATAGNQTARPPRDQHLIQRTS